MATIPQGYQVLRLDDDNLDLSKATGNAVLQPVPPADPVTGKPITPQAWAMRMNTYQGVLWNELKTLWPNLVIIHNTPWYTSVNGGTPGTDPYTLADWHFCDCVEKEQGFCDPGITGGDGYWSLASLFAWMRRAHEAGKGVFIEETDATNIGYSLACSFLMTNGTDRINIKGYDMPASLQALDLGMPLQNAERNAFGLWQREFAGGIALANEPGAAPLVLTLPAPRRNAITGSMDSTISLGASQGGIWIS